MAQALVVSGADVALVDMNSEKSNSKWRLDGGTDI
jgi:hypothetical protein